MDVKAVEFYYNKLDRNKFVEVDYDKNVVFELTYPQGYYAYRAKKSDWDFSINLIAGDSNLDNIVDIKIDFTNYFLY